jgi:hypothetical protein
MLDQASQARRAGEAITRFIDSGHLIRALIELRTLLDETRFWSDPAPSAAVRAIYVRAVERFAERGVNESELGVSLRA